MKKDLLNATVIQDLEDLEEMEQSTAKVGNASAWAFFMLWKYGRKRGWPFDDCLGRFRSMWNDAYLLSWSHLAFSCS